VKKILIVNANYYKKISANLVFSANKKLKEHKIKTKIVEVPGVFEIPFILSKYIKKYDAFLALGCVIKGETPHFDLICRSTFDAIIKISVINKKPIGNGIITSLNMGQALARSSIIKSPKKINKGIEAAKAVISLLKDEPKKN
jgi:6,7-dimethyl-8-ribityllumazine synthase